MVHYNEAFRAAQTDGSGSESINDVIGGRADDVGTDTLAGRMASLDEHTHSAQKVYPTLAASPTVTDGGGAWGLGNFVEIVPATTITNRFDIHYLFITEISAQKLYELVLYQGAGDTEVGRYRFQGIAGGKIDHAPIQTVRIPANAKIRAKVASEDGGETCDVAIAYHEYA